MRERLTKILGIFVFLFVLQQLVLSVGQNEWNVSSFDTNNKSTAAVRVNVTIIAKNIEVTALQDGSLMSLTCQTEAPDGFPPSNIYWYHRRYLGNPTNTPQLASSPPHLVSNSSNVSFRIRKETVGTYECIVEIPGFPNNISKQILIPNNWARDWSSKATDANTSWGSPVTILVIVVALIFISLVTAGCTFCWFRCRRIGQYKVPAAEPELEPGNKLAEATATYDYKSEDRSITKIGVLPKPNRNEDETVCNKKECECDKDVLPIKIQFSNSNDSDIKTDSGRFERFPRVDSDCHYIGDGSNLTDSKQSRLSEVDDMSNETNIDAATLAAGTTSEVNLSKIKTSFKRASHLKHKRQYSCVKVNVETPKVAMPFPDTEVIQNSSQSQSFAPTTSAAGLVCGPQAERFFEFPPGLENRLHDHAMDQRARVYESDVFASFDREMSAKRYLFDSVGE